MMNLRHLKLWKRHGAGSSSGGPAAASPTAAAAGAPAVAGGGAPGGGGRGGATTITGRGGGAGGSSCLNNETTTVLVVKSSRDCDVTSPSSDSGYSDVVQPTSYPMFPGVRQHQNGGRHRQQQQPTVVEPSTAAPVAVVRGRCVGRTSGIPTNNATAPSQLMPPPASHRLPSHHRMMPGGGDSQPGGTAISYRGLKGSALPSSTRGRTSPRRDAKTGLVLSSQQTTTAKATTCVDGESFLKLVRERNVDKVRQVLRESKYDVNTRHAMGRTAVHIAASSADNAANDVTLLRTLINHGADVNIKDETTGRETALHVAMRTRHLAAMEVLIEAPGFDIVRCGSLQRHRKLRELCLVDDVYRPPLPSATRSADDEETIPKRRSFGDQFLLSCRQSNTLRSLTDLDLLPRHGSRRRELCRFRQMAAPASRFQNEEEVYRHGSRLPLSDVILLNDDRLPPLGEVLRAVEPDTLSRLYVVGCRLRLDVEGQMLLAGVSLRSLVLSYTSLTHIPECVFDMPCLEVLKVDHNRLVEVPSLLGRLERLSTFCCASQRPRLRCLPASITRLHQLQVLSFSDNAIDGMDWVVTLPNLRVLRCDRNCISHLPAQLVNLRQLTCLDVSHNPISRVPFQLLDLLTTASSLCRFDWFSPTLRPAYLRRRSTAALAAHLRLQASLSPADRKDIQPDDDVTVCDVTVGIFGETGSGKTTLVRALKDPRGICAGSSSSTPGRYGQQRPLSVDRFSIAVASTPSSASGVDAVSSPGMHRRNSDTSRTNGTSAATCTSEGISASGICDVTTVTFSGEHADAYVRQLKTDVRILLVDVASLEPSQNGGGGQQHVFSRHVTRTRMWLEALYELEPDSPILVVGTHADLVRSTAAFDELFDELFPADARRQHLRRYAADRCPQCLLCSDVRKLSTATSSTSTSHQLIKSRSSPGGHFEDLQIASLDGLASGVGCGGSRSNLLPAPSSSLPLPHIVGYTLVDSVRFYPKSESKKTNVSVERLRATIRRIGLSRGERIPASWADFGRHVHGLGYDCGLASTPCLPLDDVVCIGRRYGIDSTQVPVALHRLHRRGQIVFFTEDDDTSSSSCSSFLSRVVVVDSSWFVDVIARATSEASLSSGGHVDGLQMARDLVADSIGDHLDLPTGKTVPGSGLVAQWILGAFERLEVCVPLGAGTSTRRNVGVFFFPDQLESGTPNRDAWPDRPEVDERQVTCEVGLREPGGFRMFGDLLTSLCGRRGRERLDVLTDPLPVLLAHDAVFFTALDVDGCPDCKPTRAVRIRTGTGSRNTAADDDDLENEADTVCDNEDDDVLHKVRLTLNVSRFDAIRIQIRGPRPCCVLRAVIAFIDLHVDDLPPEVTWSDDIPEVAAASERTSATSFSPASTDDAFSGGESTSPSDSTTLTSSSDAAATTDSGGFPPDAVIEAETSRSLHFLCPKCVLLGEPRPERIAYRSLVDRRRKAVCSKWHNLGSWTRAVTGDYRFGGAGGVGGACVDRPVVFSLAPSTLPDYEHPRLFLLLPASHAMSARAWRTAGRARFLEGHDLHVLCESPSAWHLVDGCGLRLPGPSPSDASRRALHSVRTLTVLDLALTIVQLIQGANEHSQTGRLLSPVIADLLCTYEYLRSTAATDSSSSPIFVSRRDAEIFLANNKDRVATLLTRALTSAAQQTAGADSSQQADLYLKAGSCLGPDDVFSASGASATSRSSRAELGRFLRLETSGGRFGGLRPVYVSGDVRWVCEAHYTELRSMPSVQLHL